MAITTKNICIFGDSIAYGAWDSGIGGWVDRIRQFLHDRTYQSRFTDYYFVYHLGIPGNTTRDILRRLPVEARAREPHLIIFAVGINDARHQDAEKTQNVPADEFTNNIRALIMEARGGAHPRRSARDIMFIGLTEVDEQKTMPFEENTYFENSSIARYNEIIKTVCKQEKVPFVDMSGVLDPLNDLEDGLHPNEEGHKKIFEAVKKMLEKNGDVS